ncbi:uncharacterized protein LOC110238953 [Exaiptasia diaphana]|uniref:Uncharacterized protein n=1 Tax=Exaiptasia diaphana TaxID=2652724 RepID=A0A913X922_EXADI|nr:uncharacterized protein LOC110238953 [Exaiptasia diaphana]KXJ14385.1 hypothetical protein AC249_AIPGENE22281 [Exaiptasia diaphana]
MYSVSKLNKQNEQTWINLQKRLNDVQFKYDNLFPEAVYQFIQNKATSVGSCDGYFIPSLLTASAFVMANRKAVVETASHNQPLNLYTIFLGHPGTGKSSAIQYGAQEPLENLNYTSSIVSKFSSLPTADRGYT